MAVKTRHCGHEPETHVYRRSKSARVLCCQECYIKFLRDELVEQFGEDFVSHLDYIRDLNMDGAFEICEVTVKADKDFE